MYRPLTVCLLDRMEGSYDFDKKGRGLRGGRLHVEPSGFVEGRVLQTTFQLEHRFRRAVLKIEK